MPNMGYARFRNTVTDLDDCLTGIEEAIEGEELSDEELRAAIRLVMICGRIVKTVSDAASNKQSVDSDITPTFSRKKLLSS